MRWRAGVLAGAALVAAGCSSGVSTTTGTVTGTYIRVGGPAGAPDVPLPGTISFRGQSGSSISFNSDNTGKFTGQLPPGSYAVTARSSQINGGAMRCSRPLTTRVQAGKTTTVALICDIP